MRTRIIGLPLCLLLASTGLAAEGYSSVPEPGAAAKSAMRAAVTPRLGVAAVAAAIRLPTETVVMGAGGIAVFTATSEHHGGDNGEDYSADYGAFNSGYDHQPSLGARPRP
jgi:hypothetical protein